jgi:hypothetical protein
MTADKARKQAARRLAADTGLPYTVARREAAPSAWDDVLMPLEADLGFVAGVAYLQADRLTVEQLLREAADVEALATEPADPAAERPGHRRRRLQYARMGEVYRSVVEERRSAG